jgi:hypothetical protein
MSERLRQILRAGRLVGVGLAGSREEIQEAAMPVLEDAEQQWQEHRRRRALNGAAVDAEAGAADPPPAPPRPASPVSPPGAIVVRRRIGGAT